MKITKRQLRRIIREEIEVISLEQGRDFAADDQGEVRMEKSQLFKIGQYAQSLHDTLGDNDELPKWVTAKIAIIANDIGKIKHHLEYKMMRMDQEPSIESIIEPVLDSYEGNLE